MVLHQIFQLRHQLQCLRKLQDHLLIPQDQVQILEKYQVQQLQQLVYMNVELWWLIGQQGLHQAQV